MASPGGNPAAAVERAFAHIAATRMADLPLNNPALSVEAVDFRPWDGVWLGVMITPWAINLMLLPGPGTTFRSLAVGQNQSWAFPCGDYEFMGGVDDELGAYQSCSLFSPVFEFASQDDARAVAGAALASLFRVDPAMATDPVLPAGSLAERPMSRRGFLGGGLLGRRK